MQKIYEDRFKSELERSHLHYFVAIEPESGEYFLGQTLSEASSACREVYPERRACVLRVGHAAALHL
jgi:hypothetical protein